MAGNPHPVYRDGVNVAKSAARSYTLLRLATADELRALDGSTFWYAYIQELGADFARSTTDTTSPDDNKTVIIDANGARWLRLALEIVVGQTPIAGGGDKKVLYDEDGKAGAYEVSGTGSVAMTSNPNISILAEGTSVARTLQKRFSQSINLMDFGALGAGASSVAEDTAAWLSAVAYAEANKKSIRIEETANFYALDDTATISGYGDLIVKGDGFPRLRNVSSGKDIFAAGSDSEIRQGDIVWQDVQLENDGGRHGLNLKKLPNVMLTHMHVSGFTAGDGISADGCYGIVTRDMLLYNNRRGIAHYNAGGNAANHYSSKVIANDTGYWFDDTEHYRPMIYGCDIESNAVGIELGGANLSIFGGYSEANTTAMIRGQAGAARRSLMVMGHSFLDEHCFEIDGLDFLWGGNNDFTYPNVELGTFANIGKVVQWDNIIAAGSYFTWDQNYRPVNGVLMTRGNDEVVEPSAGSSANCVFATAGGNAAGWTATPALGAIGSYRGSLKLYGQTANGVTIRPNDNGDDWTLQLPANDGNANSVVQSDGSGVWSHQDTTGTGNVVRATSPVLTTPIAAVVSGNTAANGSLTLQGTNHGTPAGDSVIIKGGGLNAIVVDTFGQIVTDGILVMANNKAIWVKDNGGTARDTIGMTAANVSYMRTPYASGEFALFDASYNKIISAVDAAALTVANVTRMSIDAPLQIKSYTIATKPSASANPRSLIYLSDGASNKKLAISDGTDWRYQDGTTV